MDKRVFIALKQDIIRLKEAAQDAVMLAGKYKSHMGLIDQEELARLSNVANGTGFNPAEFDMTDRNGEQGR